MLNVKINDVYKFRFSDEYIKEHYSYPGADPYHCFDGVLIVKKNENDEFIFRDTFGGGQWSRSFTPNQLMKVGQLQYYFNLDEVEKCPRHELDYYDDIDTFKLNSKNNDSKYYKRKGAKRSVGKMESVIIEIIGYLEKQVEYYTDRIKDYREKLEHVRNGDTDVRI